MATVLPASDDPPSSAPSGAASSSRQAASWRGRVGAVLVGTVCGVMCVEGAVRLSHVVAEWSYRSLDLITVPDPVRFRTLVPDTSMVVRGPHGSYRVHTTALGTRGDGPLAPLPPPATLRVLCVGDSFTFGAGVDNDETWSQRLAQYLYEPLAQRGWAVEAVNMGMSGYDPELERRDLEAFGLLLRPHVVIVALFGANDVVEIMGGRDAWAAAHRPSPPARLAAVPAPVPGSPKAGVRLKRWMSQHSVLYQLLRDRARATPALREALTRWGLMSPLTPNPDGYWYVQIARRPWDPFIEKGFERTVEAVTRMAENTRESQATFLVVLIPAAYQVDPVHWEKQLRHSGLAPHATDQQAFSRRMHRALDARGIAMLDLAPVFRAAIVGERRTLYFAKDKHWNAAGHDLAAHVIARHLQTQALLPSARPASPE